MTDDQRQRKTEPSPGEMDSPPPDFDPFRSDEKPWAPWERRFPITLAVLLALLLLPLLGRVPRAMAAYTLAYEGRPRNPGQMGRGGVNEFLLEPRLFATYIGAVIYRISGFGLTQGRAAAVIFAAIFVFSVYAAMRRLFGPVTAAAVSLMTALDPWFFLCGRTFREEIFLAALLWHSWWLLLRAISGRSAFAAFGGGFCLGLAYWTHPNALVYSVAALCALVCVGGRRVFRGRWWCWTLLGFAVGLAPYAAYVLYAQSQSEARWLEQVTRRGAAFARPLLEIIDTEVLRWSNFFRLPARIPLLLLVLWGVGWAAFKGRGSDRFMLVFVLGAALFLPLLQRVETSRYLVVLVPALAALVWRSLPIIGSMANLPERIGPRISHPRWGRITFVGLLTTYGLMSVVPTAAVVIAHRNASYDRCMARITQHIPKNAAVMAHTMFWTGLHDRRFVSSIPPSFSEWVSEDDAAAFIREHRPEYVVQSSGLYSSVGGLGPRPSDLRATVFDRACEQVAATVHSEILTEFYDRDFGAVRAWKRTWPEGD